MSNAYELGYEDCLKYNGDDANEYNPFHADSQDYMRYLGGWAAGQEEIQDQYDEQEKWDEERYNDSMDGDFDSAMESAGLGYDEQYEHNLYDDDLDGLGDF